MTPSQAQRFVEEARLLIGVRYRHGSRSRFSLDCAGIVVVPLAAVGRRVRDDRTYAMGAWGEHLYGLLATEFGPAVDDQRPGDVLLIRWYKTGHLGVLGDHPDGGLSVIHTDNLHGVVEQRYKGPIQKCTVATYRPFKELE